MLPATTWMNLENMQVKEDKNKRPCAVWFYLYEIPRTDEYLKTESLLMVQFSHSVVSDSLRPHGQQHARPSCPSPAFRVCSNSCPSSWWCHPTISSVVPLSSCLQSFPAPGLFQWVSSSHQVSKVLRFSNSASDEYSGLISFRIGWFDLLAVQGTRKSLLQPQFKGINSSALSFLYSPILITIHDYWKNHSFD